MSVTSSSSPSLPYHEPDASTLLILSSFLILLNVLNHVLDRTIYCGLIGQILLGVAFGTPALKWIDTSIENAIVDLGYIGLVLLVFEGGLSTSFRSLRANFSLSVGVALTGISLPIALSYSLLRLIPRTTALQAFAAGAALCSTSLGTTFAVLNASGLVRARMGVVLATAAMLDDVVGLVMVQVISNLGGTGEFSAVTIVRPVVVSIGFVVAVPLVAWLVARPATDRIDRYREKCDARVEMVLVSKRFALVVHTLFLVGMVAGSSYAGTSNLFAAYLAGAAISWWDSELPHPPQGRWRSPIQAISEGGETTTAISNKSTHTVHSLDQEQRTLSNIDTSGTHIFETYYQPALQRVLKPFFFASIGFSIPITQMFQGSVVWRGVVYTILMLLAKLACGVWLIRLPGLSLSLHSFQSKSARSVHGGEARPVTDTGSMKGGKKVPSEAQSRKTPRAVVDCGETQRQERRETQQPTQTPPANEGPATCAEVTSENHHKTTDQHEDSITASRRSNESRKLVRSTRGNGHEPVGTTTSDKRPGGKQERNPLPPHPHQVLSACKPVSLYPGIIVGSAMVARGEIGFLISSLAQSNGTFNDSGTGSSAANESESDTSTVFLVVTWAIMLCTIIGPVAVGLLVRRVKKLERNADGKEKDVLGVWGVG